ncbi:MAG: DUF3071 domain-containing protein [Acetobacteraceae bacterium]|nr:DUF3071 domain-containing protein [Acetobacteraceae bacterium]
MHELRLVAVSEDGSYAILAVPGRGGRYMLPIDDRLRTVARGQFSRLAQYEIEVESPLRPKEIQDRIRAGETADEIADAAGLPIERIRRFEGPVLAEREYRAQEAQRATVRSPGDSGPGPRLGDVVAERLAELGASTDDARWDSRKRPDGNWQVQIAFTAGGRTQVAEWIFDPRRRHIAPDDEQAARLCLPADELPPLSASPHPAHAPATATVTPIAPRLGGLAAHHPEQRVPAAPPVPAAAPGSSAQPGLPPARGGQGSREADAERRPPERRTADRGAAEPAAAEERSDQARERPAQERPARKAAGGRSRRASVPSWDEIMFGSSRQPD